jgi:type IV pilus assembly protein PilC
MARFLYKAKNNKGEVVTGSVRAENLPDAEKILIKHNLVATDIIPEKKPTMMNFFVSKVSVKDKAVFARQLATMLSAGLSLTKAVSILAKQARTERLRTIFVSIYRDLEEGYSFSSALAKHPEAFDRVFVSVVNSGESTGKLDVVLNELADEAENDSQFISKIKGSLYYPGFIFVVLIAAAIFMLTFVIPKLKTMFDGSGKELPALTKILLAMSAFMTSWWWLVILILVGGAVFIKYWITTDGGSHFWNNLQLTMPGFKTIFQGLAMYRFTRVMSMLVGAGVPLLDALRIGSAVIDNVIYEESILEVASQVEKGVPLSTQLLKDDFFPPLVGNMVAVGEETGELDKVLDKVADYYAEATSDISKAITSLVEPAVLILVGLGVAFMVFAIYLPIYQMNT